MFIFRPKLHKDSRRATQHIFLFPVGKIIQRVFAVCYYTQLFNIDTRILLQFQIFYILCIQIIFKIINSSLE